MSAPLGSILDLERRTKYRSREEAAAGRGISLRAVDRLLEIGRLLPVVLPVSSEGRVQR